MDNLRDSAEAFRVKRHDFAFTPIEIDCMNLLPPSLFKLLALARPRCGAASHVPCTPVTFLDGSDCIGRIFDVKVHLGDHFVAVLLTTMGT